MRCRLVRARRGRCREVILYARCADGAKRVVRVDGFVPYFYVPSRLGEYRALDGETVTRVTVECPEHVREEREKYPRHYEADIPYARRFLIDTGITEGFEYPGGGVARVDQLRPAPARDIPLLIHYLDIEVYSPDGFPSPEKAENPVVAVTVYDTWEDRYYTFYWHPAVERPATLRGRRGITACGGEERVRVEWVVHRAPSEEEMLLDLLTWLTARSPDYIVAWNVTFDIEYLRARMDRLGMRLPGGYVPFDLLKAYKMSGPRRRGYRLKEVTVEDGLECREDAVEAEDLLDTWQESPVEMLKYNLRDVWRIVEIDRLHRLTDYYIALRDVTGIENIATWHDGEYDITTNLPLIDTLLLRTARRRGVVLPSSGGPRETRGFKGAIVLDPVPGVHEGVAVLDMSKYYPALVISFNISPETKLERVDPVNNIWRFKLEPEGLLPATVKPLLEMEKRLREEQARHEPGTREYEELEHKIAAIKGLRNSIYGVTANVHFRLFDVDVASTITGLAREGILYVVRRTRELGYQVLYGDTDSVFIRVPFEEAQQLAETLTRDLRAYFKEKYGLPREPELTLKFEKYYSRIFFRPRTKKRYAGLLVWKKGKRVEPPQLDVTGFEAVRTDTAPFTAHAQTLLFKTILEGRDRDEILRLILRLKREAQTRPLSEIALYTGLSRDPGSYKQKSPAVRAAIYSNLYLGTRFTAGSRVRYVFVRRVKCPGLPPTDVVAFNVDTEEKVRACFEIDWNRQLERILYSPVRPVLEAVGIRVDPARLRLARNLF